MRGGIPKNPATRQRQNKSPSRATLSSIVSRRRVPPLPEIEAVEWHPLTVAFWRDTWRSPMAAEFVKADIHGLYILVDMVNRYWTKPTPQLAAEIRLQRQAFGLTPIDRRRLEWTVEKVEEAARRRVAPQAKPAEPQEPTDDPRTLLSLVG